MLGIDRDSKFNAVLQSLKEQSKHYSDSFLISLGLTEEQIQSQTLEQLRESLARVNSALQNLDKFGKLNLMQVSSNDSLIDALKNSTRSMIEVGSIPILLERKKLILNRTRSLVAEEKIDSVQNYLKKEVPDETLRNKFLAELRALKMESDLASEQDHQIIKAQNRELQKFQEDSVRLQIEMMESRSRIFRSFLEKESASTIVGIILLITFPVVFVASSALKFSYPEQLSSAFLLILGYFFGQASSNAQQKDVNSK